MSGSTKLLLTRRDAMTMIAASAAVMAAPMPVLARPENAVAITKTVFREPMSDRLAAIIVARRGQTGNLSQKVFRNSQGVVLIEEWRTPMAHGTDIYSRKEI